MNRRSNRLSLIPWVLPSSGVVCAGGGLSRVFGVAYSYWWWYSDH